MPRPPIQHHKVVHHLEVDEDVLDRVIEVVTIQATGRALGGFLSNPAVGLWVVGSIVAFIAGITGKEGAEVIWNFFAKLEGLHNAKEGQDQRDAANAFINAQRALIEFFAPFLKGRLP